MTTETKRIVMVNCSPPRVDLLRKMLADRSDLSIVATVYDGTEGLKVTRALKPDLLFTCIALPGITGLELTRKIKTELPNVGVLVGSVQSDRELEAYTIGADAFIGYPATIREVQRGVDQAIAKGEFGANYNPAREVEPPVKSDQILDTGSVSGLWKVVDVLGEPGPIIAAYFALAIIYSLLGLQGSAGAGYICGGTFAFLFVIYMISANVRRALMTKEEKDADDHYQDWPSGQRGMK